MRIATMTQLVGVVVYIFGEENYLRPEGIEIDFLHHLQIAANEVRRDRAAS